MIGGETDPLSADPSGGNDHDDPQGDAPQADQTGDVVMVDPSRHRPSVPGRSGGEVLLESNRRPGPPWWLMSDVNPGTGWWQATDGRWYPPELKPARHLARHDTGATVLEEIDPASAPGATDHHDDVGAGERVGGAIESHTELYLGRPAGLQNRPAAWFALLGALVMVAGALLPWAQKATVRGGAELGWRDAEGDPGGGFFVLLLAITVMTISVRCMAGSYSRGWRAALVALAVASLGLLAVEAVRVQQAIDEVAELSRGAVALSFGPGLLVGAVGAAVVLIAAGAYRVGSPH